MWHKLAPLMLSVLCLTSAAPAQADIACTLVHKVGDKNPVFQQGQHCDTAFSPASTFKLPLALIGFEEGILQSPDTPAVTYDPDLNAPFKSWRQTTTPRTWLKFSVVWYSQWLTRRLGASAFQHHVDRLNYGNRDLRGTPGKDEGLTHAWLSSSLKITPTQQAEFLQRLVLQDLPYTQRAMEQTLATSQSFSASTGHRLKGKTGNAWAVDSQSKRLKEQHGWFVGWLTHQEAQYVFVHLIVEDGAASGFASNRARKYVLFRLPEWLEGQ
ncbi:penicillin-binding transpeptidase domain-containing protein [Shimia sagamensis]|uniref:Beta-lactamase n=1 Tax=Shimia sagamensis TaxID=1566352 RepID=A0ABY1P418_9RHOB|nr:penicillin-binding transpeptidase domain-containing protein [Shimia sagamensis]SMP25987.1 beta-lactamase class D/beta-lactamase class D OXA-12 [Shimia sagamensis]